MAQVSVVTAARRELAGALNPDAREFLPWWRLGGSRKQLSADAPEFTRSSLGRAVAAAAANGAVIAAPNNAGVGKAARRSASNNGQHAESTMPTFFKSHRSQWDETVKRTIFVKYIDHNVTEDILACLFQLFGTVVDCRICGDPTSDDGLRFGFVELQHEDEAIASLDLDGYIISVSPLSVSRSRTAICPINPKFLPQSEAEWETCLRTIYCTNISKNVTSSNLRSFCEAYFGKVCRVRLLDNKERSTNIAFIEFVEVYGAIAALGSGGIYVDGVPIRMCPSKSPIRTHCFGKLSS
ncbi:polyadenylate-binding protein-interacting protein 11 [Zea mays]|uniref:Polyadenylate-binding protein-interacting protein 9 n=1 Tax=Zea mays TaxID=4577 RepID=A0A1D6I1U8_MAIZE|nr:polyadenylate-binding protein-interacting protein 11 [Zea mays]ONM54183.1 Polyadenylate-binding protein-interacting protein 9 [Zea mays]|eukprot:XP_008652541.1 polyadenylate-binding protein-interacting protein 11 [Zea mays]